MKDIDGLNVSDREEDKRLPICPRCGVHDHLFAAAGTEMCSGCCKDALAEWNKIMREEANA